MATVYLCAFRSSDCCGAALWRVCFGGSMPDRYVCQRCESECLPVEDAHDVRYTEGAGRDPDHPDQGER